MALADSGVNRSLSWAKKYMQSADPFLQKSAIFELYIQSKRPEVVGQLTEALNSAKVLPESKVIALSALESNGSMAALKSLSAVAENEKADSALRKLAVQATGNVAGGEAHIVRWATNRGTILAPAARSVMEVLKSRHPDKPLDK